MTLNLHDPQERAALAGEYVLGTLAAEERRELERAAANDAALREDIGRWERRLAPLALALAPVAPRPIVWLNLLHAIGSRAAATSAAPARVTRTWAMLATAASLLLGFALYREVTAPAAPPTVVTETVATASLVAALDVPKVGVPWTVAIVPARNEITLHTTGVGDPAKGGDAELWLIADGKPVSLGLFPKDAVSVRRTLPRGLSFVAGATIAVSREPAGGSKTGAPTGPVLTTATLLQAS